MDVLSRHVAVITPRGWSLLVSGLVFLVAALGFQWGDLGLVATMGLLLFYGVVGVTSFLSAFLVRGFARSDQEIRREIEHDIILGTLLCTPDRVRVDVDQGEVTLSGELDNELDADLLPRLVRRVPGVVSVTADLSWTFDEEYVT